MQFDYMKEKKEKSINLTNSEVSLLSWLYPKSAPSWHEFCADVSKYQFFTTVKHDVEDKKCIENPFCIKSNFCYNSHIKYNFVTKDTPKTLKSWVFLE